jgi:ABC-type bacteriocin/lantibiotic exporter with double-glycine peptidase domain
MNYELNSEQNKKKLSAWEALRAFWPFLAGERNTLVFAGLATLANSLVNLVSPLIIAHVVDVYIVPRQFSGVITFGFILFGLYGGTLYELCTNASHGRDGAARSF